MTSEFNELLPVSLAEKPQIWIIGDRVQFTPIVPAPFAEGKYMSVLVR